MNDFFMWRKREKRLIVFLKAITLALLPIMCCAIYCIMQGYQLKDIYLPSSEWNDELFYYKQVESIINYGYPMGYFGFNESHALKLSFAAWSPVLMFPWVIWGLLFGWNLMSPVICNIILMSLACFLFVLLVRSNWKQLISLILLFCFYTPFIRYMLSGMAESICFSMLIIFYSIVINYLSKKQHYKLFLLFLLSGIMTLMRPYLALFLLLPVYLWIHNGTAKIIKIKRSVGSAFFITIILGLYAFIKHYLGAAYFDPLFSTDWISSFFNQGLFSGIYNFAKKIYSNGRTFILYIIEASRSGLYAGTFYAGYMICLIMLLLQFFKDWRSHRLLHENTKKTEDKNVSDQSQNTACNLIIEVHLILSSIAMLFALLLMYKLPEGGRHLSIFIAADIFVLTYLIGVHFSKKIFFTAITFAYLFVCMIHYDLPFAQAERIASINEFQKGLSACLTLDNEDAPSYENVVIWATGDMVNDQPKATSWQLLYALPKGFGISCCTYDYVVNNFDSLQSRYIFVVQGGIIEEKCILANYIKLAECEEMVLYLRVFPPKNR